MFFSVSLYITPTGWLTFIAKIYTVGLFSEIKLHLLLVTYFHAEL